jgi:hypothetical protein
MTAHSDGQGSSWNETLDVDQPHGLDYREWNDIRIGTRKRLEQEHATFADNTVGGIHTPGGAAILGIEDGTATIVADGTLKGHGIAWDNSSRLYCSTAVAGASTTGDWTLIKLHPDKQWGGQDITWTGDHSFAKDVSVAVALYVENSADVSDFGVKGDMSVAGAFNQVSCITSGGGFLDEDDLASDATASVASQQSIKAYITSLLADGMTFGDEEAAAEFNIGPLQIKFGKETVNGNSTEPLTFIGKGLTNFTNFCGNVQVSYALENSGLDNPCAWNDADKTGFDLINGDGNQRAISWFCIGR